MFGERDVLVKREQYRDMVRKAEYKRFVRPAHTANTQSGRFGFLEVLRRGVRQRAGAAEHSIRLATGHQE